MCGIGGIVIKPNCSVPMLRKSLQAMQSAMIHRGPDDGGLFIAKNERIGLVNRRLAIRDLSPLGHMPMGNPDGNIWITFNGEIFNADEIRDELIRAGFCFKSLGDTEVILRGYECWGASVVQHLRGEFAFAIVDERTSNVGRSILLARDRLGIKPLYYALTPDAFVFASELKALQASGIVPCEVSPTSVVAYLLWGSVPTPMTIYHNIQAIPPAALVTLDHALNPIIEKYWHIPSETSISTNPADEIEKSRELLQEAVQIRLVSDVPLGAFLSGGLDSSAVVALMKQAAHKSIRTCSMIFEEEDYTESAYSRAVAAWCGAEHFERVITQQDVIQHFNSIMQSLDQPSIDGVNTYFVSLTAREAGLTVALSGLGGDELFGGYENTFAGVPSVLRGLQLAHSVPIGSRLIGYALQGLAHENRWQKLSDALTRPVSLSSAYFVRRGLFAPQEVKRMVTPEVWDIAQQYDPISQIRNSTPIPKMDVFNWVTHAELMNYTHHQLLRDTDIMSMAHSLEVRVPLLDHILVERMVTLAASVKKAGSGPKPLMQQAVGHLLPPAVRERKDKKGFVFPFATWLQSNLGNTIRAQLGASNHFLQPDTVSSAWTQYRQGKLHWSRLWALITLQGWLEQ